MEQSAPNCIKHFHWWIESYWPIRFDVTIVSIGNSCKVKPDWLESTGKSRKYFIQLDAGADFWPHEISKCD